MRGETCEERTVRETKRVRAKYVRREKCEGRNV